MPFASVMLFDAGGACRGYSQSRQDIFNILLDILEFMMCTNTISGSDNIVQKTKLALDGWWEQLLPSDLHEVAAAFQSSTGASSEIIVATILSAIGALVSRRYEAESIFGKKVPLNTYFLVAGESGEGKSVALSEILYPFFKHDKFLREVLENIKENYEAEYETWKIHLNQIKKRISRSSADGFDFAELKSVLKAHLESRPAHNENSGSILTNPTMAGLLEHLSSTHCGAFLANPDSGKMFGDVVLKNLPYFCSAWSGEPIVAKQKYRDYFIYNPELTMLLMLQPMYLAGLFSEHSDFRRSGLAARTLFLKASSRAYYARARDGEYAREIREKWAESVSNWLTISIRHDPRKNSSEKIIVRLSSDAREYLATLHENAKAMALPGREMSTMKDYALRQHEHVLRISALYCLTKNNESPIVGIDDVHRAENFVNRAFDFAGQEIYKDSEEAKVVNDANRIMNFIAGRISEGRVFNNGIQHVLLMSDLMQYGPIRKKEALDKALSFLIWSRKILMGSFTYQDDGRLKTRKSVFVCDIYPVPSGNGWQGIGNPTPTLI